MVSTINNNQSTINKGFTILEVLIVLAILALIAGLSYVALLNFNQDQILKHDSEALAALLQEARSFATSSFEASRYGVHFDSAGRRAVLFRGDEYQTGQPVSEIILNPRLNFLQVSFPAGEVVFSRLKGEVEAAGSIVLGLPNGSRQTTINILRTGLVELSF